MEYDYVECVSYCKLFALQYFTSHSTEIKATLIINIHCTPLDKSHNVYGPAYEEKHFYDDSLIVKYCINNVGHGHIGPYYIRSSGDGTPLRVVYRQHGVRHNMFGPAVASYSTNGELICFEYYIDGVLYDETKYKSLLAACGKK
jgi:hypothetical protein